jgi:Signal peptidase, peptidase S26
MEPNFHGERFQCSCEVCQQRFFLASDTVRDPSDIRCPRCLGSASKLNAVPPDVVRIVPIDPRTKLARYDCVVMEEPGSNRLELKRIVGLPKESIRIIQGDVWVNGERAQKTPQQFLDQAIVVGEWHELASRQPTSHETYLFRNSNVWPRSFSKIDTKPSSIHDDYPMIASKSLWPSVAKDIGIVFELDEVPRVPTEFAIEISMDEMISVLVSISLEPSLFFDKQTNSGAREDTSPNWLSKPNSPFLSVAHVDGRVIASVGRKSLSVQVVLEASGMVSPAVPFAFTLVHGILCVRKAHVVRDLVYRGENGEEEFTLPSVFGYHLLGDGVPISHDSRQRWPNGVPRAWILGRVDRN